MRHRGVQQSGSRRQPRALGGQLVEAPDGVARPADRRAAASAARRRRRCRTSDRALRVAEMRHRGVQQSGSRRQPRALGGQLVATCIRPSPDRHRPRHSHTVNTDRTASTRSANRRGQRKPAPDGSCERADRPPTASTEPAATCIRPSPDRHRPRHSHTVNTDRTASTRSANRRPGRWLTAASSSVSSRTS